MRRPLPSSTPPQAPAAPRVTGARQPRVPRAVAAVLLLALGAQIAWRWTGAAAGADARDLPEAPSAAALRLASLGEPEAASKVAMLYLQAYDDPNVHWREMDYGHLRDWLARALDLAPRSQYPLLAASELYTAVQDPPRVQTMLDFVHDRFKEDPNRRWPWLAHAALIAQHRLHDPQQAQRYAAELRAQASEAPQWARELQPLLAGTELQATRRLAGAMLTTGQITDASELRLLERRLQATETRATPPDAALR
ncbi:hypothetical protein [Pseudoduganella sp. RAF53_2]|uniref:hypothetical protein n=1 Tax=unclassified Pseudoduganella TaxID=2637179 RepID=UPI003F9E8541